MVRYLQSEGQTDISSRTADVRSRIKARKIKKANVGQRIAQVRAFLNQRFVPARDRSQRVKEQELCAEDAQFVQLR